MLLVGATVWLAGVAGEGRSFGQDYDDRPGDIFDTPTADPGVVEAVAPSSPAMVEGELTARDQRVWPQLWRRYSLLYVVFEDGYHPILSYNTNYPSSRGKTVAQFMEEQTRLVTETVGVNMTRTTRIIPPRVDVEPFVKAIPRLAPGEYGHAHSCLVNRVLGPDQMLVSDLWLIDAEELADQVQRETVRARQAGQESAAHRWVEGQYAYRQRLVQMQRTSEMSQPVRLVGYDTRPVTEGRRWGGPIGQGFVLYVLKIGPSEPPGMAREQSEDSRRRFSRRSRDVPVAVAPSLLGNTLSEEQFRDLLARNNTTVTRFVDLVFEQNKVSIRDVEARVVAELERRHAPPAQAAGGGEAPAKVEPGRTDP